MTTDLKKNRKRRALMIRRVALIILGIATFMLGACKSPTSTDASGEADIIVTNDYRDAVDIYMDGEFKFTIGDKWTIEIDDVDTRRTSAGSQAGRHPDRHRLGHDRCHGTDGLRLDRRRPAGHRCHQQHRTKSCRIYMDGVVPVRPRGRGRPVDQGRRVRGEAPSGRQRGNGTPGGVDQDQGRRIQGLHLDD